MILRAVGKAAFGSAPSFGTSLYSPECSALLSTPQQGFQISLLCCCPVMTQQCFLHRQIYGLFAGHFSFQVLISTHSFCWLTGDLKKRNQKQEIF